jgi:hypothetical protein
MIKEVKMFTAICDNCGTDVCESEEFSCWNEEFYVNDIASEKDWHVDGDIHYCPACHSFNEDDILVINEELKKKQ